MEVGRHGKSKEISMSTTQTTAVRPFQVSFSQEDLDELRRRIAATRSPSKELVADASQGVQLATLQALAQYWGTEYDLRRVETRSEERRVGKEWRDSEARARYQRE